MLTSCYDLSHVTSDYNSKQQGAVCHSGGNAGFPPDQARDADLCSPGRLSNRSGTGLGRSGGQDPGDVQRWSLSVCRVEETTAKGQMVTYALDSSAVLRFLDDEPGSDRVAEIIKLHLSGGCKAIVSALHWGEIAGVTCKVHGQSAMDLD